MLNWFASFALAKFLQPIYNDVLNGNTSGVTMIPPFTEAGLLPPGIYWATWEEIVEVYGWNSRRQDLLFGLRKALMSLQNAGCETVYLNGSFVTSKEDPGDFDGCWELEGVSLDLLESTLLDFTPGCHAQKGNSKESSFQTSQNRQEKAFL